MTHWIVCPTRNNLHLLKKAVASFRAQDIGDVEIFILDNGSTDNTVAWLQSQPDLHHIHFGGLGMSVAASWNTGLMHVFRVERRPYALVVNNDVELRPDTYRWLVEQGSGFVTAVGVREREQVLAHPAPDLEKTSPHPDFSCFLIRSYVYTLVGPFDENFKNAFCEDWDYHVRLHKAGVPAVAIDLPYLHHGSMTIQNAVDEEKKRIHAQAELNREYFFKKWGVRGGTPEYEAIFQEKEITQHDCP